MISCCSGVENLQCLVTHNGREGLARAGPGGRVSSPPAQLLPLPLEMAEPPAGDSHGQGLWKVLCPGGPILKPPVELIL